MLLATQTFALLLVACTRLCLTDGSFCKEPENVEEIKSDLRVELQHRYIHETSFYNNPVFLRKANESLTYQHLKLKSSVTAGRKKHQRIPGQASCRKARKRADTVCPSFVIMEYDVDREPANMAKAKCTCKRCFHPHALTECAAKCTRVDRCKGCWVENRCEEVYSYIPVIRRRCVNGQYQYFIYIEPMAVGCTCRNRDIIGDAAN